MIIQNLRNTKISTVNLLLITNLCIALYMPIKDYAFGNTTVSRSIIVQNTQEKIAWDDLKKTICRNAVIGMIENDINTNYVSASLKKSYEEFVMDNPERKLVATELDKISIKLLDRYRCRAVFKQEGVLASFILNLESNPSYPFNYVVDDINEVVGKTGF